MAVGALLVTHADVHHADQHRADTSSARGTVERERVEGWTVSEVRSAGLLVFRHADGGPQLLLGHMGGPLWAHRDDGAWSIPKGQYEPDETPEQAAAREFTEELGLPAPPEPWLPLGEARQRSGKVVVIFAVEGELDPADVVPGTFTMRWPPRSNRLQEFPEIDRVAWFTPDVASLKLTAGQRVYVDRLLEALGSG